MTEPAPLGAPALRTGRVLEWDARAMKVTNGDKADSLIDPPCRAGWTPVAGGRHLSRGLEHRSADLSY